MDEQSIKYLSQYIQLSDKVVKAIMKHSKRYSIKVGICAWYSDIEDFFSDWCTIGYTRTQARKLLHGGIGEFQTLPEGKGIIRYSFQNCIQADSIDFITRGEEVYILKGTCLYRISGMKEVEETQWKKLLEI